MSEENKKPEFKTEEEMTPEELKAQQENEDFLLGLTDEDLTDPDKQEEIQKRLKDAQTTIHQKRHFRDKLEEIKKATPPANKEEKKPEKKADGANDAGIDPYVALEFRQDHPELTREVVKEILDYAGAKKISPEEALTKPLIQKFIKDEQNKQDVDDASLPPGGRGAGSGIEKKDWSTASQADIEKQRNAILNKGSQS